MPDTNDHSISWWITKRTPTFTVSTNSVNLQDSEGKRNSTFVVNRQGNGKISAVSGDLTVASTFVSGNNVTVTRQGEGSTNVYVMVGSDTTYKIPEAKIVTVNCASDVIVQSSCNVAIAQISTGTLRYDDTCIFNVTRSGNGNISFAADGDNKISVTKSENITNGKRFTVKWQDTGTVKLTATVAETVYHKSGTATINCTVYGKLPNLSINDVTVTALSSTQATFSHEGTGVITVNQPSGNYVSIESDTAKRFTFKGLKMGSPEVTATVAAGSFTIFGDVTSNDTDVVYTPSYVGNGQFRFYAEKPGTANITFTVHDPDGIYNDVQTSCKITVVKRDRNVSYSGLSDIQMYHSGVVTVIYDGDGNIQTDNASRLNLSISGKKITYTPTGIGTGKFKFTIPANDYYNAYDSGDLSVKISKCTDAIYKVFYTEKTSASPDNLSSSDLVAVNGESDITIHSEEVNPDNKDIRFWVFVYVDNVKVYNGSPALTLTDVCDISDPYRGTPASNGIIVNGPTMTANYVSSSSSQNVRGKLVITLEETTYLPEFKTNKITVFATHAIAQY